MMIKSYLMFLNLEMFLDLVLLFLMIWHLVIDVCQESLIWRLDKHSVVKINWLIELNNDTLHIQLNIKSNSRTQYLFNYNVCKHSNVSGIYIEGYHKRSDSFEIAKLKGSHTSVSTFVQNNHHQINTNFIVTAISTLVMNKILITIASI